MNIFTGLSQQTKITDLFAFKNQHPRCDITWKDVKDVFIKCTPDNKSIPIVDVSHVHNLEYRNVVLVSPGDSFILVTYEQRGLSVELPKVGYASDFTVLPAKMGSNETIVADVNYDVPGKFEIVNWAGILEHDGAACNKILWIEVRRSDMDAE